MVCIFSKVSASQIYTNRSSDPAEKNLDSSGVYFNKITDPLCLLCKFLNVYLKSEKLIFKIWNIIFIILKI